MRKLTTIIAALALVLALAAPAMAQGNPAADDPFVTVDPDTPPCPIGLDEAEAQTGQQLVCGEGGGYLPKGSSGSAE